MAKRLLKCCTGSDNSYNKNDDNKPHSKTAQEEEEEELLRLKKKENGFNWLFFKRSWKLHGLLFPSWTSVTTCLALLLLLVGASEEVVGYYVGLISSDYYQLLGDKDLDGFLDHMWYSLELIVAISVIKTIRTFIQKNLVAAWRKSVTKAMHRAYFVNVRFYQLNVLGSECSANIDNADQRITADVESLTHSYGLIFANLILFPLVCGYYSYDAYTRAGWPGPVGMLLIFLVASVLNKLLISPVSSAQAEHERREGLFRFTHLSARTESEGIAFSQATKLEHNRLDGGLNFLLTAQRRVYWFSLPLDLAVNLFAYFGAIASFIVIAIPIFTGYYDDLSYGELVDLISENAFVCINLIFTFTGLVRMSATVAEMSGVTHRIVELLECLRDMPANPAPFGSGEIPQITTNSLVRPEPEDQEVAFDIRNVSYTTPTSARPLVKSLSLELRTGKNLLIMGPSSCGKSSLLRVLRGLWPVEEGEVRCNSQMKSMFLPQRARLLEGGSLKQQIVYPLDGSEVELSPEQEKIIVDWMEKFGLAGVLKRPEIDGDLNRNPGWSRWQDVLSPGEAQRLVFIRLFYHRPSMALLDEATSSLSSELEHSLMQHCKDMSITLVSVGHRESLMKWHQKLLRLSGDAEGSWNVSDIN